MRKGAVRPLTPSRVRTLLFVVNRFFYRFTPYSDEARIFIAAVAYVVGPLPLVAGFFLFLRSASLAFFLFPLFAEISVHPQETYLYMQGAQVERLGIIAEQETSAGNMPVYALPHCVTQMVLRNRMRHIPTKLPQRGSATPRKSVEVCSVEGGCISPLELGVGGMTVGNGGLDKFAVSVSEEG